jgi:hypothetical protein
VENGWGFTWILGELKEAGLTASMNTVKRILHAAVLDPY